jgi:hypothetical protein
MKKMIAKPRLTVLMLFLWLIFPGHDLLGIGAIDTPAGEKVPYRVPGIDTKIRIDGVLDDEGWKKALKLELDYEFSPGENIQPPVRTEVFLAFSRNHFYIGFRAYDPDPSAIRARLTDRDHIFDDDWVSISFDTFNARRRYYTFFCNPLGIQSEAIETNTTRNTNWDTIWSSAGRVDNQGYTVEMAIPFNSLRFQRKKEDQVWGFDAARRYPRGLDHLIGIFPHDRNNFCYMCQMEKLIGFKGAKPGKSIEFNPTLSALLTQEREDFPGGEMVKKLDRIDPGITAQWGFTPNMTLSGTINPDFSHVEADVAQLDINTQFALYYPEKRPFFLEESSIFDTRLPAIYTRTMAEPDWGIKLTGKEGAHTVGFYSARDNITNLLFPGSYGSASTSLDMKTLGTVLRYRLDLGKISTLGVLLTDREGKDYYNRLAGVDAFLRITPRKHITAQFLASRTRYPHQAALDYEQPGDQFTGTAMDFIFRHESRNIGYYASYQQVSPDFRADLGFMPQVGYRNITGGIILASWRNPGHWYTFMNAMPTYQYEVDFDGNLIYKSLTLTCNYMGPSQSYIRLMGRLGKQSLLGNSFNTNYGDVYFSINPSGSLILYTGAIFGQQIDFSNIRQGKRLMLYPGLNVKMGRHFSLNLDHIFERFNVDAGHLYTANVSNLRLVYQFSRRAFLRTILQYADYKYNTELYTFPINPIYRHLFSQVLFSYKINARTVLFLGYSDDYYGFDEISLTQNNRTFFLKIGYALVL